MAATDYRDPQYLAVLPAHMHSAVLLYIERGLLERGDFLDAVVTNNLKNAILLADHENRDAIVVWVIYFYQHAPSLCWGSKEKVEDWIKRGGLRGFEGGTERPPASVSSNLAKLDEPLDDPGDR